MLIVAIEWLGLMMLPKDYAVLHYYNCEMTISCMKSGEMEHVLLIDSLAEVVVPRETFHYSVRQRNRPKGYVSQKEVKYWIVPILRGRLR